VLDVRWAHEAGEVIEERETVHKEDRKMAETPRRHPVRASHLLPTLVVVAVAALVTVASAGAAGRHSAVAPSNTSPPTISGSATVGNTVTANEGTWSGTSPISFSYQWRICGPDGGACRGIAGQTKNTYHIRTEDPGNTLRVQVTASNADGSSSALSIPSARIALGSGPANTAPPTISGTTSVHSTLTAEPGKWTGSGPVTFTYQWRICDADGGGCHDIAGATEQAYQLKGSDLANTIRVKVTATDSTGPASSTSVPTARISAAAGAPAPTPSGCPKMVSGARAVAVKDVAAPARLQIDQFVSNVRPITGGLTTFTVRFHIRDTCGQPVDGAVVFATGVPYNQVTTPAEAVTDAGGWVTLRFNREAGFPAARNQQLMVVFVRARKPGDPMLGGISTRRLISLPVNLTG
jgi:protocatechuate 3,4-dioxygenase beta subunit